MLFAGISLARKPQKRHRGETHLVISDVLMWTYIKKPDR